MDPPNVRKYKGNMGGAGATLASPPVPEAHQSNLQSQMLRLPYKRTSVEAYNAHKYPHRCWGRCHLREGSIAILISLNLNV
jgi:hypothetical protein